MERPVRVSPLAAPVVPSTLEPAFTVNEPFSFSNLIFVSSLGFATLVTVIPPGIIAPPVGLPSASNSPLVCKPIVPPLPSSETPIGATWISLISSLWIFSILLFTSSNLPSSVLIVISPIVALGSTISAPQ